MHHWKCVKTLNISKENPDGHRKADQEDNRDSTEGNAVTVSPSRFASTSIFRPGKKDTISTGPHSGIVYGELIGWRFWRVLPLLCADGTFTRRLWSPVVPMVWPIEGVVHAGCPWTTVEEGAGIFASDAMSNLDSLGIFNFLGAHVIGTVTGWGTVIKHELGWRAEYARITGIYEGSGLKNEQLKELARLYNVPLVDSEGNPEEK